MVDDVNPLQHVYKHNANWLPFSMQMILGTRYDNKDNKLGTFKSCCVFQLIVYRQETAIDNLGAENYYKLNDFWYIGNGSVRLVPTRQPMNRINTNEKRSKKTALTKDMKGVRNREMRLEKKNRKLILWAISARSLTRHSLTVVGNSFLFQESKRVVAISIRWFSRQGCRRTGHDRCMCRDNRHRLFFRSISQFQAPKPKRRVHLLFLLSTPEI